MGLSTRQPMRPPACLRSPSNAIGNTQEVATGAQMLHTQNASAWFRWSGSRELRTRGNERKLGLFHDAAIITPGQRHYKEEEYE